MNKVSSVQVISCFCVVQPFTPARLSGPENDPLPFHLWALGKDISVLHTFLTRHTKVLGHQRRKKVPKRGCDRDGRGVGTGSSEESEAPAGPEGPGPCGRQPKVQQQGCTVAPSLPDSLTGPSTASRVPAHIWASPPPSSLPAHRPWAEGLTAGAELGPPPADPQRWLPQGCVLSPTLLNSVLRSSCSRAVENILPACMTAAQPQRGAHTLAIFITTASSSAHTGVGPVPSARSTRLRDGCERGR